MKIGSLFTGYGGLDMAIDGELTWYSEIDPAACSVLAAHHPNVQNLGDITKIRWEQIEQVDVITGGYPCQPFSHAGKREGTNDPRHLWPYVKEAINVLRPKLAVLENVRGHISLGLKEVLADLTDIGYDARWEVIRASDAGAPHQRARVFILAYPNSRRHGQQQNTNRVESLGRWDEAETREREWSRQVIDTGDPFASSDSSRRFRGTWQRRGYIESKRATGSSTQTSPFDWRQYGPAISRWESVIGRMSPFPTILVKDKDRVNPAFVEWMMGLPDGHVTGHGLTNAQTLKLLGNGVVPQQAALALHRLSN